MASNTYGNQETSNSYDATTLTYTLNQVCVAPVNDLQFDNTNNDWTSATDPNNPSNTLFGSWGNRVISTS